MLATLGLPRRHALVPFLAIMVLVPSAQRVAILSLDFPFLRILVVVLLVRVAAWGEAARYLWKPLDTLMVLWIVATFAAELLRTGGALVVYQCGVTVDALGGYFAVRCLIRGWEELGSLARAASWLAVPVALAFLFENATQRNLFAFFGGVPEITVIREDRMRCQGPYSHPILAGCFWASLLPLMAARWWQGGSAKTEALLSSCAALSIVYCCASSTPVFGVLGAAIGVLFYSLRHQMRLVRWSLLFGIIALHVAMKAPVWHLISRVSAVGGSTSYFRYMLIDSFIRRFPEWAFVGVNSTAHWFWGGQDLTNHFVGQGVTGGFATLVFFIAIISVAFGGLGRAWREQLDRPSQIFAWALGVSLLVHVFNFFGVSYFGTITALWYLTLGVIGSLTPVRVPVPSTRLAKVAPRWAGRPT
ncbi:MAG: hypothetical protein AMXMBFR47_14400 [Planctomycetota bacterium]